MAMRIGCMLLALFAFASLPTLATPPEPSGPHPRLFLDAPTRARLKELAKDRDSAVAEAVRTCKRMYSHADDYARDGYMGLDWAHHLQICLVAWAATDDDSAARTALIYFKALLDDRQTVGDGEGGDKAATRDSGYAIRAHGPYTALAYDWLHDHTAMSDELKAHARERFTAWLDWYAKEGYRVRSPGTNYHAGYALAAALIAVAQGSEGGADGARWWRTVSDELFAKDLLPSAREGVLVGGDWGEGWQYGPLSIAEYSLAARAVEPYGIDVAPMRRWLREVLLRHVYALTPGGKRTFVLGDTQAESANLSVRRRTLEAVVFGPSAREDKEWALGEIERVGTFAPGDLDFVLFTALADAAPVTAKPLPRETMPKAYFAAGTSVLYARTGWDAKAAWFVASCSPVIDVDHLPPNAGNFVLMRGNRNVIVDPSPYGSLSSLTSNTPTVRSPNLPKDYQPSQAFWGKKTGFRWRDTLPGDALLARCDYADQYWLQQNPTDVDEALRDFVMLPYESADGSDSVALFIADRAKPPGAKPALYLQFRSPMKLAANGSGARADGGDTHLEIAQLQASAGKPEVHAQKAGSCFDDKRYTRGNCDAARIPVHDFRLVVEAERASAVHLIDASPRDAVPAPAKPLVAQGGAAWLVERGKSRWVVALADGSGPLSYVAPASDVLHVVLPAAAKGAKGVQAEVARVDGGCRSTIAVAGEPVTFTSDAACARGAAVRTQVPAGAQALPARAP